MRPFDNRQRCVQRRALLICLAALGSTTALAQAADTPKPGDVETTEKTQAKKQTPPATESAFTADNPFAQPSGLAFQAPAFDTIDDADFMPAIDEGMRRQARQVTAIAQNEAAPTFENTIVALEKSGRLLERTTNVFHALTGANTNDALQHVEQVEAPRLAAHQDAIYLNSALFKRVARLYEQRNSLDLPAEAQRLLRHYYKTFVHRGAKLSDADQAQLREINKQLSSLATEFTQKLLAANKAQAPIFKHAKALEGLSESDIAAAKRSAADNDQEDAYRLALQNTTQQPPLADLKNRETRKTLFQASWTRTAQGGDDDTRDVIETMAGLRADKAALLGYDTYADYKLYDQMARTPQTALGFMHRLAEPAVERANAEAADLQAEIEADDKSFKLEPWDWNYYAEKLRKKRYDLDQAAVKPYFALDNVLQKGVFYAAHQLYGLTFKERKDLPVYQPDVRVFTVYDADGSELGLFYADYFKRENKRGGAWMSSLVGQSTLFGTKPVIYNVCNFAKPAPGEPALLGYDDVITMFHEFGHALHGFFANTTYPTLSGTATPRDFVEFPSQFNEHWAMAPQVFDHYALHYKTGAPMPETLKTKLKAARDFNQGYRMTELISAALLDMAWHTISAGADNKDTAIFQKRALESANIYLPHKVPPRYSSSYFQHIWGNGYAAGYYAYLWTQMLADNGFEWFKAHGGLTRDNGDRFRQMILSIGNTRDLHDAYLAWLGHDPTVGPMLEYRGLADEQPFDDRHEENRAAPHNNADDTTTTVDTASTKDDATPKP